MQCNGNASFLAGIIGVRKNEWDGTALYILYLYIGVLICYAYLMQPWVPPLISKWWTEKEIWTIDRTSRHVCHPFLVHLECHAINIYSILIILVSSMYFLHSLLYIIITTASHLNVPLILFIFYFKGIYNYVNFNWSFHYYIVLKLRSGWETFSLVRLTL